MPDFFGAATVTADPIGVIVLRLVVAMLFGGVVAFVYRRTRRVAAGSFTTTLLLLAILIAMVTQVIGDNVARAFSLVGALSIVRFRTVVRDTQDTAYVIAAVAVGMAVGAGHFWVAVAGIAVVTAAAFATRSDQPPETAVDLPFTLQVRLALGLDEAMVVAPVLAQFAAVSRVMSVATARQGGSLDVSYRLALKDQHQAQALVSAVNRLEGVQSVGLNRSDVIVES
jgi:uncharacterized membrane protein YhiD involved in acid resistance